MVLYESVYIIPITAYTNNRLYAYTPLKGLLAHCASALFDGIMLVPVLPCFN
jgi:hypothetical protein